MAKWRKRISSQKKVRFCFLQQIFFLSLLKPRFPILLKYYSWIDTCPVIKKKKTPFLRCDNDSFTFLYFTQSYKMYIFVYSSLDNNIKWSMPHRYVCKSNICHIAKIQMWIIFLTTQRNPYFDLNFCHSIWMKENT